jgi:hypothetical protein
LIKWLIVKHQPIKEEEEDLDAVEEDVEEEDVDLMEDVEDQEVEADQTEVANQKKEELGFQ